MGGRYHYVLDVPFRKIQVPLGKVFGKDSREDLSVDVMMIEAQSVACVGVDGKRNPFDATGHYPLLAGYDTCGRARYLAMAVNMSLIDSSGIETYYFSCVAEGESTMTFFDEDGEMHVTQEFSILVLCHDPSDLHQPFPLGHERAMDQTGPLFWLKYLPTTDPDFFEDWNLDWNLGDSEISDVASSNAYDWEDVSDPDGEDGASDDFRFQEGERNFDANSEEATASEGEDAGAHPESLSTTSALTCGDTNEGDTNEGDTKTRVDREMVGNGDTNTELQKLRDELRRTQDALFQREVELRRAKEEVQTRSSS